MLRSSLLSLVFVSLVASMQMEGIASLILSLIDVVIWTIIFIIQFSYHWPSHKRTKIRSWRFYWTVISYGSMLVSLVLNVLRLRGTMASIAWVAAT